jgi:sec-independent protein translocase protein TatC
MSLSEHLEALRATLLRGGLWLVVGFVGCFTVSDHLLRIVTGPHRRTMEALGEPIELNVLRYQDPFLAHLKLAIVGGLFLGLPVLVWHLWRFVAVGLYARERRTVRVVAPLVTGCFVLGVLFGYFVLVPIGLRFLAVYGDRSALVNRINLGDYLSLFLTLTLALGLVFQLPLIMWSLTRLGIVRAAQYARVRKYAIFGAVIVAAILTPPDVITQLLMAGPLVILFEVGILITGGWEHTLFRGRFLIVGVGLLLVVGGYLGWDLFRVDRALSRLEPTELTWTGGGDRPYEPRATGAARDLLELGDRALRPVVAAAQHRPELVPLAVELATRVQEATGVRDFLRETALDQRDFVRDRAALALGAAGDPEDTELLELLRTDRDRAVAVSAATMLLRRHLHTGAFSLIRTLETGPRALREAALQALVEARGGDAGSIEGWHRWYRGTWGGQLLGSHEAILDLLARDPEEPAIPVDLPRQIPEDLARQLLGSADPHVRFRAARRAPPALLQRLAGDPDPTVRLEAGRSLVAHRDRAGIPILINLVGIRPAIVSRLATRILQELSGLELAEERANWEAWWQEHRATFTFR